jgi:Recombination endonuclease VII
MPRPSRFRKLCKYGHTLADTRMKSGKKSVCGVCKVASAREGYMKKYGDRAPAERTAFNKKLKPVRDAYHLKRKFGMTMEDYEVLLRSQGGVCAVCFGPSICGRRYSIDHCHKTGKIRGILCSSCNSGIGLLKDSPEVLENAAAYLRRTE